MNVAWKDILGALVHWALQELDVQAIYVTARRRHQYSL